MGGHSSKPPQAFNPTGSPQADASYQQLTSNAQPWATGLPGATIPGFVGAVNQTMNNPYAAGAQQGANTASQIGTGMVGPQQLGMSQGLENLASAGAGTGLPLMNQGAAFGAGAYGGAMGVGQGALEQTQSLNGLALHGAGYGDPLLQQSQSMMGAGTAGLDYAQPALTQAMGFVPGTTGGAGYAPGIMGAAQGMVPGTTQAGMNAAPGVLGQGLDMAGQAYGQAQGMIPGLTGGMGYANQIMQTGFDPQQSLYNRSYQQMMDQQNAINAMNGVSGSPYGAGISGDASRNFNIDWQNQQLNRQISAMGAYNQTSGQTAQNYEGLLGAGVGAYTGLSNSAVGNYDALTSNAANNFSNLTSTGVNAYDNLTAGTANNYATLANTGVNNFNSLTNSGVQNYEGLLAGGTNAYNAMVGGSLGEYGNLLNSGVGAYGNMMNTGQNAYNNFVGTGVNAYNSLLGSTGQAYGQASDMGAAGLDTMATASQWPNATYLQNVQNQIAALQALQGGVQGAITPSLNLANAQGNYLGIGQNATSVNQNAWDLRQRANAGAASGIGQLVGLGAAML